MSTWEVIKSPGVAIVVYLYGHMALNALAYTAGSSSVFSYVLTHWFDRFLIVVPLFWFTSPELGGLGFSPLQISMFLGIAGLSQALWLFPFPTLQHRFGTGGIIRACAVFWPIFMSLNPLANLILRQGWTTAFWILVVSGQVFGSAVSLVFSTFLFV
jgi:hypothetical protein